MRYLPQVTISLFLNLASGAPAWSADPEILTMSASEDAGGATESDLDLQALKMLENRTVQQLENKMRAYLGSQGQTPQLSKLEAESHTSMHKVESLR